MLDKEASITVLLYLPVPKSLAPFTAFSTTKRTPWVCVGIVQFKPLKNPPNLLIMLGVAPNIIGGILWSKTRDISGALINNENDYWGNTAEGGEGAYIKFDASKSNSMYSKSTTVQTNSIKVLFIIKL